MSAEVWAERTARLVAAKQAVDERQPARCYECGAPDPVPTFEPIEGWQCENPSCRVMWSEQ